VRWWLVRPRARRSALQPRSGPAAILHVLHGGGADALGRTCQSVITLYIAPWRQPTGAGPAAPAPPPHQAGQAHQQPPADVQSAENPAATSPRPQQAAGRLQPGPQGPAATSRKERGCRGELRLARTGHPTTSRDPKNGPPVEPDLARVNTGVERGLGRVDVGSVPTLAEDVGGGAECRRCCVERETSGGGVGGERSSTAEQGCAGCFWRSLPTYQ
jgi:hypothetical protein